MKTFFTKNKILIGLVVFLLIINITAVLSIFYNNYRIRNVKPPLYIPQHGPRHGDGRFLKDALHLSDDQLIKFQSAHRVFQSQAWQIKDQLHSKRIDFLTELGNENPDTNKIKKISEEIGHLHTNLKLETSLYYFEMKNICTQSQQKDLHAFFMMTIGNEDREMMHGLQVPGKKHHQRKNIKY